MFEAGAAPGRAVVRPHVAAALGQPVGALLLAALTDLLAQELTAREALEVTCAWQRLQAHCAAGQLEAVTRLDRAMCGDAAARARPGRRDSTRPAADELAPALRIAPTSATRLVLLARQLEDLPAAADALAEGRMHPGQLRVLATATRDLPEAARRAVEALAVRRTSTSVPADLADALAEEACHADPAHAAREAARGVTERDVRLTRSSQPGCKRLVADLPTLDAIAAWQVVNGGAVAARDGAPPGRPEERSLPQLRADVLASILTGQLPETPSVGTPSAGRSGAPVPTRVPTPAERSGLAEVHVVVSAGDLPGDLPGDPPCGPPDDPPDDPQDRPSHQPPGTTGEGSDRCGPHDGPRSEGRIIDDENGDDRVDHDSNDHDRHADDRHVLRPWGHVPGHGPLDASATSAALSRAPWRRLVADASTGALLERSSGRLLPPPSGCPDDRRAQLVAEPRTGVPPPGSGYRPGRMLAAFVRARDATCIGPACHHSTRSAGVQLDHTVDHARGGPTAAGNLGAVCRRTHQAKTHGGWRLSQPAPGVFVWVSSLARTYRRGARPVLPGWSRRQAPG